MNLNRLRLFLMRFFAVVYFVIFFRIRGDVVPLFFFIGLALAAAGEATRVLAQSVISKNDELAKTGIYACCRNPLYLGSFIILLGFLCFTVTKKFHLDVFLFWLVVLASNFIIYKKKIKEEEKILTAIFKGEFEEYKKNVPSFIPSLSSTLKQAFRTKLNFKRIVSNREHKMLIGLIVMLIVIGGGIFYY